ncbi:MAG: primosomal protein N' [Bacteroidales bacterium]|nr:primosomal protein N' [Lentimicrobiaceae bacterium]MDD5694331.1 primosomal protein N' [Bacteroidales bacterium]
MSSTPLFAEVILPLPVAGTFTYKIPETHDHEVAVGQRVVVQFGNKKIYTAIISSLHSNEPQQFEAKTILDVLDPYPVVNLLQLNLWNWIADYYMAFPGDVMNAALPSGLKLQSETRLILHPEFKQQEIQLSDREFLVAEALVNREELTVTEVSRILGHARVMPVIKDLIEKKVLLVREELVQQYKPKTDTFVTLAEDYASDEKLNQLFDELNKRAYKQLEILITYIRLSAYGKIPHLDVKRNDLLKNANATPAQFAALQKKGIFKTEDRMISRLQIDDSKLITERVQLTGHQEQAFASIKKQLIEKDTVLLFGVTSSGKTEIYIKLIQEYIDAGKQVLYLLPEIALTTQIIERLRRFFGNKVGVYHSRYNDFERVEIWNNVLGKELSPSGSYQIILGARSALFLPFSNLGLIIVDEEHDTSFKQQDPAPRYNARDTALYLARLHHAKTILGSATPALETYFLCSTEKYGMVTLTERYGGLQLPVIQLVNIREENRMKRMKSIFAETLLQQIRLALDRKEQIILFQNRRGFSLRIECDICNWIPSCRNCDVSLIYHKQVNQLRCHYCGYSIPVPEKCPDCHETKLLMRGFGTEKVEEELAVLLPGATIARMDLDTTRTRNAYHQIINDFETRKIDILVGTQMVTKGLDFENVSLVAILNADSMLNFPDFRSFERSYQLMSQVSGRAGRKNKRGLVIIQSYNPSHPIIQQVVENDYKGMYDLQLAERKRFHYPPFYRLILLRIRHRDFQFLNTVAREFADILKKTYPGQVLGPEYPMVARIRNKYIKQVMIKLERNSAIAADKKKITGVIGKFLSQHIYKQVDIIVDVDPL